MAKWSLIQYLSSQRVLNTFLQNNQTTTLLMTIHPIIETIFHKYKDRVIGEEEICAHLLQVYMSTAMHLFLIQTTNSFSQMQIFFKQSFSCICTKEIAAYLWELCSANASEPTGLFVFVSVLRATFSVASDFFVDKFEDITSLLREGISSDSQLLRDAAAQAAADFAKTFVIETDELSFVFSRRHSTRCSRKHISGFLDATNLLFIVSRTSRSVSTLKIFEHYNELFDVLMEIVSSSAAALVNAQRSSSGRASSRSSSRVSRTVSSLRRAWQRWMR